MKVAGDQRWRSSAAELAQQTNDDGAGDDQSMPMVQKGRQWMREDTAKVMTHRMEQEG